MVAAGIGVFVLAVEAVAATGAHPTPKHAQKHPAASRRNCFIVTSEYASTLVIAAKKSKIVLENSDLFYPSDQRDASSRIGMR